MKRGVVSLNNAELEAVLSMDDFEMLPGKIVSKIKNLAKNKTEVSFQVDAEDVETLLDALPAPKISVEVDSVRQKLSNWLRN